MVHVLVIDDDRIQRAIMERFLLKRFQCKVTLATGGLDGLAQIHTERPDLVILDVLMPGMDGFEVLSRLRADPVYHDLPVVINSALKERDSVVKLMSMGVIGYVVKPIESDTVYRQLVDVFTRLGKLRDAGGRHAGDPPVNILIIDDDAGTRQITKRFLTTRFRCTVSLAANGPEGLQSIQNDPPDVVILDVLMPGMSGYDVLSAIRQNGKTKEIPVVINSSVVEREAVMKLMGMGVSGYMVKPIEPEVAFKQLVDLFTGIGLVSAASLQI